MIATISFFIQAVNHSIRCLAGSTRPVATYCPGLAELIRRLPSGILSPPILSVCVSFFFFCPNFHLNFNMLYVCVSFIPPCDSPGPSITFTWSADWKMWRHLKTQQGAVEVRLAGAVLFSELRLARQNVSHDHFKLSPALHWIIFRLMHEHYWQNVIKP